MKNKIGEVIIEELSKLEDIDRIRTVIQICENRETKIIQNVLFIGKNIKTEEVHGNSLKLMWEKYWLFLRNKGLEKTKKDATIKETS